jgi:hypothetical protein
LESDYLADSGLAQTLESFVEPAFLLNEDGEVLFSNAAAHRGAFREPPLWLSAIPQISDVSTLARLALVNELKFRGRRLFLVQPRETAPPDEEEMRVLKVLSGLPAELHNVGELMLRGLSDRMIARCTDQDYEIVRAQVLKVYELLGVSSRSELVKVEPEE